MRVCVAGATGWVGRGLVPAIEAAPDLTLVGAVARRAAGQRLGAVTVAPTVAAALETPTDVLVDFTSAAAVKANALAALARKVHVVVGSSGLDDADFPELDAAARASGVGVVAAGNFAITAVLLMRFAEMAARFVPSWEIIDFGKAAKPDAPSGTARELANRLAPAGPVPLAVPIADTLGPREARGANLGGAQVHSVRLPGYVSSVEIIFGKAGERLHLRHESGDGAAPYVDGTLLAIRRVSSLVGLVRGLDRLLDLG